jgi:hypothetical protein
MKHIEKITREEYLGGEIIIRGKAICGAEFTYSQDDTPTDDEPVCEECIKCFKES